MILFLQRKSVGRFTLLTASGAVRHQPNGRRISCKKRESRTAFELRCQLNSHVGRRCAPDDRRMFRRPLNGRAASVQHSLNLHLRLCRRIAAAKLARKLRCRIGTLSNFRDKTNVRLKPCQTRFFYLYLLLDNYTLHYFASYFYPFINEKTDSLSITRLKHQNTTFIFLSK